MQKPKTLKNGKPLTIRWMFKRDMNAVCNIEFMQSNRYWKENDFLITLHQKGHFGIVAEVDGQVVGFMVYELAKKQFNLLNLGIHPYFERQGLGTILIQKICSKVKDKNCTNPDATNKKDKIVAKVSEMNLNFQLFLKANNFVATKIIKKFSPDFQEDGYRMEYGHTGPFQKGKVDQIKANKV